MKQMTPKQEAKAILARHYDIKATQAKYGRLDIFQSDSGPWCPEKISSVHKNWWAMFGSMIARNKVKPMDAVCAIWICLACETCTVATGSGQPVPITNQAAMV